MKFVLGLKFGMSQIFDEKGNRIPVSLIEVGPCEVTQIKTKEKDGYNAIQVGFKKIEKPKKIKKPMKGKEFKYLREFRIVKEDKSSFPPFAVAQVGDEAKASSSPFAVAQVGDEAKASSSPFAVAQVIDVSIFKTGDIVKVSGLSKGKGFAGAVKRWGFKGRLSVTHGTKHELRTLGSVGSSFPERVTKGRKMAGRMGFERVTVKNLKVVKVDKENNILAVKGAVPGRKGTLLEIRG